MDTIFAQASAKGRAGIAVVRLSGPEALTAAGRLCGNLPPPRTAALRWLRDPDTDEALDQGVVVSFPGPHSFTGEDVVELQVHGSAAVIASLLAALQRLPGLRLADPGEFTRRAFLNDRLDLAQVEGLADLLAAETAAQQRLALSTLGGALSRNAYEWRAHLVHALAFIEASIDFADEELPAGVVDTARADLDMVSASFAVALRGGRAAERIREGFEVALVGPPNVGKSTLLNALAGREAALTSEVAGTTRDVIEVRMDLDGLPITLLDTAGLREAEGPVEAMGIERARARAQSADVRVFLVEAAETVTSLGLTVQDGDLVVLAKADTRQPSPGLAVSGVTGQGVDALLEALGALLGERAAAAGSITHERQRLAIERASSAVEAARLEIGRQPFAAELVAEELRAALNALDFLVGRVDVEAVLEVVFSSFCLGK